jgi:nucleotidyltransferase/DNA polymerase involved in DNA repair
VVARSPEVKALGIPMGVPLFKIKPEVEKYNIKVLSSNYALYGDMSHRVMQVLAQFSPDLALIIHERLEENKNKEGRRIYVKKKGRDVNSKKKMHRKEDFIGVSHPKSAKKDRPILWNGKN